MLHAHQTLLRYAVRQWPALLTVLTLGAASAALAAAMPWPTKLLVDHALGGAALPADLEMAIGRVGAAPTPTLLIGLAAGGSLLLFATATAIDSLSSWIWSVASQRMRYDVSCQLLHRLQRLPISVHSRRGTGDALARITEDAWSVSSLTDSLLLSPAQRILTLASVGVLAWTLDPTLTVLSLVSVPVIATSVSFFGGRIKGRARALRASRSRLTSFVHQTLASVPVVQAFGTEDRNREEFRSLADQATGAAQSGTLLRSLFNLLNGSTMAIATALVLYVGGTRVLAGVLSVGSLLVFVSYVRSIRDASQGLLGTYAQLRSIEASADRVLEVLESSEGVRDSADARPLTAPVRGAVSFEHVTFAYEPGRPVLHDVDLEVRPGETLALVGPTGAGKTTLLSLLPRFFDPDQGRVTLDGHDLRDLTLESLREHVALVLQEPFLLPVSIADNIAYGCPRASRERIREAARAAHADAFIQRLPDGYDTVLGERGATLSGGEQQRIAIARALLKDAPVLLLDEPTSALDAQSERLVLDAIDRLIQGRTTLLIAHRLSTVRRASRIAVVDQGRIVEIGTHQQLLEQHGLYRTLHDLQHDASFSRREVA